MELTDQVLADIALFTRGQETKKKALDLLSRRMHSRKELQRKLKEKGFDPDETEKVLDNLEERGLLDDRAFAAEFIEAGKRKNWSDKKLNYELSARGVGREIVEELLDSQEDEGARLRAAFDKARRGKDLSDPKIRQRVKGALLRQGFSYSDLAPLFQEHLDEFE